MFRENNIEFEQIDYFNGGLTEEKIRGLLKKLNLTAFEILRAKEPLFQELNLSAKMPPDEIIKLIVAHPNLLQRPIVEVGARAILARPIEKAFELIKSGG